MIQPEWRYSSTRVFCPSCNLLCWIIMFTITPSRVEIVNYMYSFDRKLIVVSLILFVSDGSNGWYPCLPHSLRHILEVFHTNITPQLTAQPVDIVHTICRAICMPPSVERRWHILQNWPYHKRGRLGGMQPLRQKVTCLSPREFGDTHALLRVHRYASQEHAFKKVSVNHGNCWTYTCIRHERRRKSHRQS